MGCHRPAATAGGRAALPSLSFFLRRPLRLHLSFPTSPAAVASLSFQAARGDDASSVFLQTPSVAGGRLKHLAICFSCVLKCDSWTAKPTCYVLLKSRDFKLCSSDCLHKLSSSCWHSCLMCSWILVKRLLLPPQFDILFRDFDDQCYEFIIDLSIFVVPNWCFNLKFNVWCNAQYDNTHFLDQ